VGVAIASLVVYTLGIILAGTAGGLLLRDLFKSRPLAVEEPIFLCGFTGFQGILFVALKAPAG
jgi:hypothetical protein